MSSVADTANLGATSVPGPGEGQGPGDTLTRLRRTQNAHVCVERNENGTSARIEPDSDNDRSCWTRPDVTGGGAVVTVVEEVRQAGMLPARPGGLLLDFVRALLFRLTLRPSGILGCGALGGPALSACVSQRSHQGHRAHESKKHHGRR